MLTLSPRATETFALLTSFCPCIPIHPSAAPPPSGRCHFEKQIDSVVTQPGSKGGPPRLPSYGTHVNWCRDGTQAGAGMCDGERGVVIKGEMYSRLKCSCWNAAHEDECVSKCICLGPLLPLLSRSATLPRPAIWSVSANPAMCPVAEPLVEHCRWTSCPGPPPALGLL